jgi:hypothetical protein
MMHVRIPALGQRKEHCEFEASLSYLTTPSLKTTTAKKYQESIT